MTAEEILNRMLNRIPNTLDKRKGSIIYLALAPVADELAKKYEILEETYDRTFADTAVGDDLKRRAAERGVKPTLPSSAIRKGIFNMVLPVGSRFGLETTTYIVIEHLENNEAKLRCEQLGEVGNAYTGDMLPITPIPGLTIAKLTDILVPGQDIEDDESLRSKYYENLESMPFGGNKAEYKKKTKELPGVGGVKVYPVWNGGGTVKLVIIDSTYNKPSAVLVDEVQTAIDPIPNQGEGLGLAPIDHIVTVEAVDELVVNIASQITLKPGYIWEDVESPIIEAVNEYFLVLKKIWENEDTLVVRISQIESAILHVTGILDIQNTTLNSSVTNLILTDIQIPVLGTVTQA